MKTISRMAAVVGAGVVLVGSLLAAPAASAVPLWPDAGVGAWGVGTLGQIGDNNTAATNSAPVVTDATGVLAGKVVTAVSGGNNFACAIASGAAYCWGQRSAGRLGDGGLTNGQSNVPVAVSTSGVLSGKTLTALSAGGGQACVLDTAGLAYCWGGGGSGQLGNGASSNAGSPVAVTMPSGKTFTSISAGFNHTCASTTDGLAYCWGANDAGQLGTGNTSPSTTPVAVDVTGALASKTVTSVSAGYTYACAVASGAAYCWGQQEGGKLGNNDGAVASVLSPVAVYAAGHLSGLTVTQISAGGTSSALSGTPAGAAGSQGNTCAVADGKPYCWGYGGTGRLGTGNQASSYVPLPVYVSGALSGKTIRTLSVGWNHACVTTTDFGAYCWGSSTSGQVGNSTTTFSNVPAAVSTPDSFKVSFSSSGANRPVLAVAAGKDFSLGAYGYATWAGSPTASYSAPTLSWGPPIYTGTTALTYYLIMYRLHSNPTDPFKTFMKVPSNVTSLNFDTYASSGCPASSVCVRAYGAVLNNVAYDFQVTALNSTGNGRPSPQVNVTWNIP